MCEICELKYFIDRLLDYRQQSKAAREIFQQIETLIIEYLDGLYTAGEFMEIFGELKQKYTEELK